MNMWKNININTNQIKAETGKSVLIAMPHNSDYDGYSFWHPSKLVRTGRHSAAVSIGYTDEFIFRLKKYGKGKYNSREIIAEKEITATEFEEAMSNTDYNISEPEEPLIHIPESLKPEHATVDESLIDNG